ncbi:pilin [Francisella uliginis]|uniref:Type IV pili fiber building block protein n=1 Tax=Francisella uliginis TaxID=573570 RepID=A0A1L4BQV7_9GAMM|nr:pilin [Francisella uliginis]API86240.1 hypothetical protein F7310_02225 [Francisella uliginis]
MKIFKTKTQKGFSLVELMVVIAIIAILAAIAMPMYSDYTVRAKLGSQLTKIGAIKTSAVEYIIENEGNTNYSVINIQNLPPGVTVNDGVTTGRIDIDTSSIISGSKIMLTPTAGSGSVTWDCSVEGVDRSQAPTSCSIV